MSDRIKLNLFIRSGLVMHTVDSWISGLSQDAVKYSTFHFYKITIAYATDLDYKLGLEFDNYNCFS